MSIDSYSLLNASLGALASRMRPLLPASRQVPALTIEPASQKAEEKQAGQPATSPAMSLPPLPGDVVAVKKRIEPILPVLRQAQALALNVRRDTSSLSTQEIPAPRTPPPPGTWESPGNRRANAVEAVLPPVQNPTLSPKPTLIRETREERFASRAAGQVAPPNLFEGTEEHRVALTPSVSIPSMKPDRSPEAAFLQPSVRTPESLLTKGLATTGIPDPNKGPSIAAPAQSFEAGSAEVFRVADVPKQAANGRVESESGVENRSPVNEVPVSKTGSFLTSPLPPSVPNRDYPKPENIRVPEIPVKTGETTAPPQGTVFPMRGNSGSELPTPPPALVTASPPPSTPERSKIDNTFIRQESPAIQDPLPVTSPGVPGPRPGIAISTVPVDAKEATLAPGFSAPKVPDVALANLSDRMVKVRNESFEPKAAPVVPPLMIRIPERPAIEALSARPDERISMFPIRTSTASRPGAERLPAPSTGIGEPPVMKTANEPVRSPNAAPAVAPMEIARPQKREMLTAPPAAITVSPRVELPRTEFAPPPMAPTPLTAGAVQQPLGVSSREAGARPAGREATLASASPEWIRQRVTFEPVQVGSTEAKPRVVAVPLSLAPEPERPVQAAAGAGDVAVEPKKSVDPLPPSPPIPLPVRTEKDLREEAVRELRREAVREVQRREILDEARVAAVPWTPQERPARPEGPVSGSRESIVAMNTTEREPSDKRNPSPRALLLAPLREEATLPPATDLRAERLIIIGETGSENVARREGIGDNKQAKPMTLPETGGLMIPRREQDEAAVPMVYAPDPAPPVRAERPVLATEVRSRFVRVPVVNVLDLVL